MRSREPQKIAALALTVLLLIAGGVAILHFRIPQTDIYLLDDSNAVLLPHSPLAGNSPSRLAAQQLATARNAAQQVQLAAIPGAANVPDVAVAAAPARPSALGGAAPVRVPQRAGVTSSAASTQMVGPAPSPLNLDTADLSSVAGTMPPPLELEREREEAAVNPDRSAQITIETGFECSPQMPVRQISPTHFALETPSKYWFMFRVHGVAGRLVRFDIVSSGVGLDAWSSLNPVYTYATDLDDPATYAVDESADPIASGQQERAWNGALLPSTATQKWHYIPTAWEQDANQFSFVLRFEESDAVVAMRVPYPPRYNERFFQGLASNPHAKVAEIGRSALNRPLFMAKIGEGGDEAERRKPCVLVYAGEHADEPDAMWVANRAADFLSSTAPVAASLRQRVTFLVIPSLDPDAAAEALHSGIILSFLKETRTPESIAYANWFAAWVRNGGRLDVVLDLHNVQSAEAGAVSCALMQALGEKGTACSALNHILAIKLEAASVATDPNPWAQGWSPDRLGGWLSRRYGPICVAYELNSMDRTRHLTLSDMGRVGYVFAKSTADFIDSNDGARLLTAVAASRAERDARWGKHAIVPGDVDAITAEAIVSRGYGVASENVNAPIENWIP